MKKIFTLIITVLCAAALFAQAPERFSYQAVVRNASNALMVNAQVGVRVNIMQGSATGSAVYSETHIVTTNTNGLMTLNIGSGSVLHGNLEGINWADGPYYLKTDIDPNGGNDYTITTTQQLLSVPYALYAKDAGNVPTIPTNISAFTNDAGYLTSQDMPEIPTVPTNVSAFTNDAGYLTNYIETDPQYNAWNKDYNDLINKPTIPVVPTNVSAFTNDAGYITSANIPTVPTNLSAFNNDVGYVTATQIPSQVNADWNATTGAALILNKPNLFSGNYNDLTNKPTIPTIPANVSAFNNDAGYITVSNIPSNVSVFNNDAHYITEAELNALLSSMNNTIDSLRDRIEELETNPPAPQTSAPTVTTMAVSSITTTSAICGGNVTSDGSSTVTARGVCWGTSHNPTVSGNHTSDGSGIGSFTSSISGLSANTTYYVRAYAANGIGTSYGSEVSFTTSTPFVCGTGTVTDYDGNVYNTVQIGDQCWLKENLRSTHYANGIAISEGYGSFSTTEAYYYSVSGNFYYGNLYNWKAVMGNASSSAANPSGVQGVCPNGWHVPSDAEWTQLTNYVSGQSQYLCSNNTANIAKSLASTTEWHTNSATCAVGSNLNNNNSTGFSVLPAGEYFVSQAGDQYIYGPGSLAYFWSATEASSSKAWNRAMAYSSAQVSRYGSDAKYYGFSVRCVHGAGSFLTTPTVTTNTTVNNVTSTTATCGGNITSDGDATVTARGVCWSTSQNPTVNGSHTTDGSGIGSFTSNISGLSANTTYYVRAYATNSVGTAYGEEISFTTLSTPIINTNTVSEITTTAASCGGNVTSDGGAMVTTRGVCWSTSQNPTVSGSHTTNGNGTGSFTSNITGLSTNTMYYVRAYATNSVGTAYGEQRSFTTVGVPSVTTNSVSNITATTASCGGNVTSTGGTSVTARGVCWSTSQNPTVSGSHTIDGSGSGSFTSSITGLSDNTTYYVRAYATNSVGTVYGEQKTFTTVTIPIVTTNTVSSITATTALCGGNVISTGGSSVTARGVCWSISQNPTVSGSHTADGSGSGSYTSSITGLTANTTYYVRAYATNSAGTAYGEQRTFTTTAGSQPTVTTSTVSNVTKTTAACGGNVTSTGGTSVTARGVCWSTSQNPTISDSHTTNGSGTGSFTSSITGLSANTTYYVRAYATNSVGTAYGELRSFTTTNGTTAPNAPTGVTVTNIGTSSSPQIEISWNSVSNATSYKVYRCSTANGTYSQIGSATSNTYLYDNSPLSGYNYYKVKAVNSAGESGYSSYDYYNNSGGGTTVPNAPTGVTVTNIGTSSSPQIKISWNSVSNATSYKVYRCSTSSGTYSQIGSATSNTYLYDNSPLSGYNYYKVKAVNSAGESGYSSYDYYNNTGGGGGTNTPCPPTVSVGSGTYSQTVSWTVNTGSGCGTPTSFQVWQFIPCTNQWLQLGTTSSHSYVSTSVYPGVNQYKVVAVNSAGTAEGTANSSSVPLSAPSGALWTDDLGNGCVQFSWSAVDMATGYEIWYSTNGVNYYLDQTINDGGATTTTKCYTQFSGDIVSFKIRAFFNCYGLGPTIDPIYSSFVTGGTIWF